MRPEPVLQLAEQVQDLRLDRDIEGGDGFVADDQFRLRRQRSRDADPLALAARELVREERRLFGPEADAVEKFGDAQVPPGGVADFHEVHRLAHDGAGAHARIER